MSSEDVEDIKLLLLKIDEELAGNEERMNNLRKQKRILEKVLLSLTPPEPAAPLPPAASTPPLTPAASTPPLTPKPAAPPPEPVQEEAILKKLLLVGDSGTGKSNLLSRYTNNTFHSQYRSTIGVEFSTKTTQVDGKSLKLQIWDTAGQERYRAITGAYYRGASGILLVYDVTSTQSFANLENWHKEIMEHAPEAKLIVVGNKCDTVFDRKITALQGEGLAHQYNAEFIETSAMNDTNVEEAFAKLAASLIHN